MANIIFDILFSLLLWPRKTPLRFAVTITVLIIGLAVFAVIRQSTFSH